MTLSRMTDADKVMNRQHIQSNPADIRIQINLETGIRILDHFRLRLGALPYVCALGQQSSFSCKSFAYGGPQKCGSSFSMITLPNHNQFE